MTFKLSDLFTPFNENDLDWLPVKSGLQNNGNPWSMVAPYVDARAIMDRLDSVLGPQNWKDEYRHQGKGVICRLSIRIGEEWVSKEDGSEETSIDEFKGGISKALVRTGVKWGIGRYLYNVPTVYADFNEIKKIDPRARSVKIESKYYDWLPPKLPAQFLPDKGEARKEERKEIAKKAGEAAASIPKTKKQLGDDIFSLLGRRGLTPKDLNVIIFDQFNVNNPKDLDMEQLEKLFNFIEESVKEEAV